MQDSDLVDLSNLSFSISKFCSPIKKLIFIPGSRQDSMINFQ